MGESELATRLSFERIGSDLTPYPFLHIFPQDQYERLLERLRVSVERRTELVSFTDEGERVIARLRGPAGQDETCIAGCDGAHSTVRNTIGTAFPGGTYRQVFYVTDVEAASSRYAACAVGQDRRPRLGPLSCDTRASPFSK